MVQTAKAHFDEDLERARNLLTHAETQATSILKDDLLRSCWMMGVGACDAYFSDAYADMIAKTLRAKEAQPEIEFPDRLNNLKLPVIAIVGDRNGGWRWRMAARELIESENVLSLEKIRSLFNQFFRDNRKIISQVTIGEWLLHADAPQRLFSVNKTRYRAMTPPNKSRAKKNGLKQFTKSFDDIFQRRHDCIHNCDRPRIALQGITSDQVDKRLEDILFLVERCHEAFLEEFSHYLKGLGFDAVTRNRVRMVQ